MLSGETRLFAEMVSLRIKDNRRHSKDMLARTFDRTEVDIAESKGYVESCTSILTYIDIVLAT